MRRGAVRVLALAGLVAMAAACSDEGVKPTVTVTAAGFAANSSSTWRQPPHGEAVIAATTTPATVMIASPVQASAGTSPIRPEPSRCATCVTVSDPSTERGCD